MRGIDVSNYSGAVGVDSFTALKADGYDFVIVGAQVDEKGNNYTGWQIAAAKQAGLQVLGVYELLYWDDRDAARFEHALSFGLPVWIDVEEASTWAWQTMNNRIKMTVDQLGDQCAGIYTRRTYWEAHNLGPYFAHLPLWEAYYPLAAQDDTALAANFPLRGGFGGWKQPAIWQSADRGTAITADLNYIPAPFPPAPPLTTPQPVKGLLAAAFVASVGNPLSDLAPEDAAAVKAVAAQL